MQQDRSGPVPGSSLTHLVWEFVPGERLGGPTVRAASVGCATTSWRLPRSERDLIRAAFREVVQSVSLHCEAFLLTRSMVRNVQNAGFWPRFAGPSNLIWQRNTKKR